MRKLLLATILSCGAALPAHAQEAPEFGEQIRGYLLEHPEVIVEALQAYEARQKQAEYEQTAERVEANRAAIFEDAGAPRFGALEPAVTIIEFADYACPHCKRANESLRTVLAAHPDAQVIIHEFPVLGDQSVLAARFALAVNQVAGSEAYHKAHNALFDISGKADLSWIEGYAATEGLDAAAILAAMDAPEVTGQIEKTMAIANDVGIRGTPFFIIGDHILPGALGADDLDAVLNDVKSRK